MRLRRGLLKEGNHRMALSWVRAAVTACAMAVLSAGLSLGCGADESTSWADGDGLVVLQAHVSTADGRGVSGASLAVVIYTTRPPQPVWAQFTENTDSTGRVDRTVRGLPLSAPVVVRVSTEPPPTSGLSARVDSLVVRMGVDAPPPDTARFEIILRPGRGFLSLEGL